MKQLLIAFMILVPVFVSAQKIKSNGIDSFTNKVAIETSQEGLLNRNKFKNQWNEVRVSLRYEDGVWSLPASVLMDKTQHFNPDCKLFLRLDNGRVVTLNATTSGEAMNSERGALGVATQTRVAPFETIYVGFTNEDIEDMRKYPVSNIRITSEMTNFDYEIKGKSADLFVRLINVIDSAQ